MSPQTSFGLPTPHPHAPLGATAWFRREYPASVWRGLNAAGRVAGGRAFALQFAMILIACLRVSPPSGLGASGEHEGMHPSLQCEETRMACAARQSTA